MHIHCCQKGGIQLSHSSQKEVKFHIVPKKILPDKDIFDPERTFRNWLTSMTSKFYPTRIGTVDSIIFRDMACHLNGEVNEQELNALINNINVTIVSSLRTVKLTMAIPMSYIFDKMNIQAYINDFVKHEILMWWNDL